MNILVINVSLRPKSPVKIFPIGLGYITTAMKNAGFDFDLMDIDAHRYSDEETERLIRKKRYDVVCMGCIVTGYRIVKALVSVVRQCHPYCKIIVGNSVATSIVDTLLTRTKADIAVISEGDETIVDLLQTISKSGRLEEVQGICFKDGDKIVSTPPRKVIKDISSLPFIDFGVYDVEIYIDNAKYEVNDPLPIPREEVRALPVNTARGCSSKCSFCYHVFKKCPYRYRSPESIVGEISALIEKYSLNYIHFWDELTFFSKKQTLELVQRILDENLHFYWTAQCRANLFTRDEDIEIIQKMKEAGCLGMGYSLESADADILKAMNKKISVGQFSKQTQLYQSAGVATWTSLVFGYPQETKETIKKTFDCCIENKIYPSAGYLLPQPCSPMYDYAIEHGFIGDEEEYLLRMGDRQDLRLNMTQMDDEELESAVVGGLKRCNEELKVGLKLEELIKTQYYRAAAEEKVTNV
jgi:anaerobic magnesium-protoporphyrin IX monomethyl ester cyclase